MSDTIGFDGNTPVKFNRDGTSQIVYVHEPLLGDWPVLFLGSIDREKRMNRLIKFVMLLLWTLGSTSPLWAEGIVEVSGRLPQNLLTEDVQFSVTIRKISEYHHKEAVANALDPIDELSQRFFIVFPSLPVQAKVPVKAELTSDTMPFFIEEAQDHQEIAESDGTFTYRYFLIMKRTQPNALHLVADTGVLPISIDFVLMNSNGDHFIAYAHNYLLQQAPLAVIFAIRDDLGTALNLMDQVLTSGLELDESWRGRLNDSKNQTQKALNGIPTDASIPCNGRLGQIRNVLKNLVFEFGSLDSRFKGTETGTLQQELRSLRTRLQDDHLGSNRFVNWSVSIACPSEN